MSEQGIRLHFQSPNTGDVPIIIESNLCVGELEVVVSLGEKCGWRESSRGCRIQEGMDNVEQI